MFQLLVLPFSSDGIFCRFFRFFYFPNMTTGKQINRIFLSDQASSNLFYSFISLFGLANCSIKQGIWTFDICHVTYRVKHRTKYTGIWVFYADCIFPDACKRLSSVWESNHSDNKINMVFVVFPNKSNSLYN